MIWALSDSFLDGIFGRMGYWAPFLTLVGAGAGLPIPEEVTMVGSGYLLHQGRVGFWPIVLVCMAATLLGDLIPYSIGRVLGPRALRIKLLRRVLHPERLALIEERLERHGNWAVFTCRWLPGLRLPGFFGAGMLGMSFGRFLLVDALAACLMVPFYVNLGRVFGEHIGELERTVKDSTAVLGLVLVCLLAFWGVHWLTRREDVRLKKLAERASAPGAGEEPHEDSTPPQA